jgi:hypothetical protein
MSTRGQYICLWLTVVVAAIWLGCFFLFPAFTTPLSPSLSPDEVAAFYRDPENMNRTRYSMILYNWFGVGLLPLYGVIVVQIKRMNHYSDVLAYGYLSAATSAVGLFMTTNLYFQVAAFRPERDPVVMQLINDMAWLNFTAPVGFLIAQNVCLALAIYLDRQKQRVFPLWVAHFNILIALAVAPAALSAMTLTGPFAWDGIWSFWGRLSAIVLWGVVMFFACWNAIAREKREEPDPAGLAIGAA